MATCGHADFITLPPTFKWLITTFPYIRANKDLDRRVPRCRLCDLIAAQVRADDAECPPPDRQNPVDRIDRRIEEWERYAEQESGSQECVTAMAILKKDREQEIVDMDKRIEDAWRQHWAIWGPGLEGPKIMETFDDIDWDLDEEVKPTSSNIADASQDAAEHEIGWESDEAEDTGLSIQISQDEVERFEVESPVDNHADLDYSPTNEGDDEAEDDDILSEEEPRGRTRTRVRHPAKKASGKRSNIARGPRR